MNSTCGSDHITGHFGRRTESKFAAAGQDSEGGKWADISNFHFNVRCNKEESCNFRTAYSVISMAGASNPEIPPLSSPMRGKDYQSLLDSRQFRSRKHVVNIYGHSISSKQRGRFDSATVSGQWSAASSLTTEAALQKGTAEVIASEKYNMRFRNILIERESY